MHEEGVDYFSIMRAAAEPIARVCMIAAVSSHEQDFRHFFHAWQKLQNSVVTLVCLTFCA
jgi:hypothetical protein